MRPDRIILGEVRSGEALDMVQAMLSGHAGSLSTIHANTPRDALIRLETMSLMSDVELPVYVARSQVASAIHLVVQLARFPEDGSRRITQITEVYGLSADNQYQTRDLFLAHAHGKGPDGKLRVDLEPTGQLATFSAEAHQQGLGSRVQWSKELWTK
jgi:pilus assembly protein CpaF